MENEETQWKKERFSKETQNNSENFETNINPDIAYIKQKISKINKRKKYKKMRYVVRATVQGDRWAMSQGEMMSHNKAMLWGAMSLADIGGRCHAIEWQCCFGRCCGGASWGEMSGDNAP